MSDRPDPTTIPTGALFRHEPGGDPRAMLVWGVRVEPDIAAAMRCETCSGSGIAPEPHEYGATEALSCQDCRGTGEWCNAEAVWSVLHHAVGIARPADEV